MKSKSPSPGTRFACLLSLLVGPVVLRVPWHEPERQPAPSIVSWRCGREPRQRSQRAWLLC